jgi:YVTN family beta-propeller protein
MNRTVAAVALGLAGLVPASALAQRRPPTHSTTVALYRNDSRLLVVNKDSNSLSVLAVRKGKADLQQRLAEVGVGLEPRCVALGIKEKEAFVTNAASGTVSVVSLKGNRAHEVVAEFAVGTEPRGCATTPNGKRLFVANYTDGTVSVIDTRSRQVVGTVPVGGNPWAVAVTTDGDRNDDDETVYVTQFFAEPIPGVERSEANDEGKQSVVQAFASTGAGAVTRVVLSPLANAGFAANRKNFCKQLNPAAHSDIFCPDTTILDPADPKIATDPQAAYPNQLYSLLVRGNQVIVPSIGAQPEPPVVFNVNIQGLVHTIDRLSQQEQANLTLNLNNQIKTEVPPDPAEGSLVRLFTNDLVALDATADGSSVFFVSRGGNYVLRASRDANGAINIGAPNVVRFQTGNLPNGIVVSKDGRRAYVNNEANYSVSVLDLAANRVLARDVPSSTTPAPGSFAHGVLVGKLIFFTALGAPDDGLSGLDIRDIVPVNFRNKASDNAWSACSSCHPDGLADGVTWIFATGPRQTLPMENFFSKLNPADQQISNYSNVQGSINDFNNGNARDVQGGKGFAGEPPNDIFNHGRTQGISEALDLETLWVQTIRPLNRPQPGNPAIGRAAFDANCASCHGGAKWTKSQTIYLNNPTFDRNPTVAGAVKFDPFLTNVGLELTQYEIGANLLTLLDPVGTFDGANPLEIRNNANTALGARGFKAASLNGIAHSAPYFHDGSAQTLDDVFAKHLLPGGGTIASRLPGDLTDLKTLLSSIDGGTPTFVSDTDRFLDAIVP